MPSRSRQEWSSVRSRNLDEIRAAHRGIGGSSRGRRFATQQINYAYTMLLSSQFQGFCRDLHSESVEHLIQYISPPTLQSSCRKYFSRGRKLDYGNPSPSNLGSDFGLLNLDFWPEVIALSPRNIARKDRLEEMSLWRNAIAHQDFSKFPTGTKLHLSRVEVWRRACDQLTRVFDNVMRVHIGFILGMVPW